MSKVRFTITTEDGPRTLFTVNERPNGALLFDTKPPPFFRLRGGATPHKIERQKYSLHLTPDAPDGNTIHGTTYFTDGSKADRYNFTRALKQYDRFAPIFIRRYPHLSQITRPSPKAAEHVDLGYVESEFFHLLLGAYVSNRDRAFSGMEGTDFSIAQHPIGRFRITVLWCFLGLPPHTSGHTAHVITERPELVEDPQEQVRNESTMNGFDEDGCLLGFGLTCRTLINDFTDEHFEGFQEPLRTQVLEAVRVLKTGQRDTAEFRAYLDTIYPLMRRLLGTAQKGQ
jgi:hypothetical protein